MFDPKMLDAYFGWGEFANRVAFDSADAAAMAFGNKYYSTSRYIRHEFGADIYSVPLKGDGKLFFLGPTLIGSPHGVGPIGESMKKYREWVTTEAFVHTHPNLSGFSRTDIRESVTLEINFYVVGPNLHMRHFDWENRDDTYVGTVGLRYLDLQYREELQRNFRSTWVNHICGVANCGNTPWPTPPRQIWR